MKKLFACLLACVTTAVFAAKVENQHLDANTEVVTSEEDPNISLDISPSNATLTVRGVSVDVGLSNRMYADLKKRVEGWSSYWNGTNAWLQITNYMHTVAGVIPEFSIWEVRDGMATNIWSDLEKFDAFIEAYKAHVKSQLHICETNMEKTVEKMLENKADRAWSLYDSGTGLAAPEGTTWISTPVTVIAGGMQYERHITSAGEIFVLKSNGLISEFGNTSTNNLTAYFTVSDSSGNSIFSVKKTDSYTDGAHISIFDRSGTTGTLGFRKREGAIGHPKCYFNTSLNIESPWIPETEANFPYNVTWTEDTVNGLWIAELSIKSGFTVGKIGFFKGAYDIAGETVIENSVPTRMNYIILGNKKYKIDPVTISGKTVMGLTEVQ